MFFKKLSSLFIATILALLAVSCSGGSTVPAQDGGTPSVDDSARVTGVVTLDDNPVENVEVAAYDVTDGSMKAHFNTGKDGKYSLNPLGGQYLILAAGNDGYSNPTPVNLSKDESSYKFDIPLERFQGSDHGFVFCRITNEGNDTPIPNATVKFGTIEARTDAWGFCLVTGLKEQDSYKLDIAARGFKGKTQEIRRGSFDRTVILNAEFFKLSPTSDIGASIGGVVRDIGTGFDLGGVFVTLEKPNDANFNPLTYMTNIGGYYRFHNLVKGTYSIKTSREGYLEDKTQAIINDQDGYYNIFLTPDTTKQGALTGMVFDATGNIPLPNVRIYISNPLFGVNKDTISSGSGSFIFNGLTFGDYYVKAIPPTALFLGQNVALSIDQDSQQMEFDLPYNDAGALMGEVTVTGLTTPPTGAIVIAEKIGAPMSGLRFETNVDPRGLYSINGMTQGIYRVKVTVKYAGDKMSEAVEENVPINPGASTVRDFELQPVQ